MSLTFTFAVTAKNDNKLKQHEYSALDTGMAAFVVIVFVIEGKLTVTRGEFQQQFLSARHEVLQCCGVFQLK